MNTKITPALRIVISIILTQILHFKFSAKSDSIYIFSKVELKPFERIGVGILELISIN